MRPGGSAIVLGVVLAAVQFDLPVFDTPDTVVIEARREGMPRPQVKLLYDSIRPGMQVPGPWRVPSPASFPSRPPCVELSGLGRIAYAADAGAYAGLSVGTLGSWFGLWDERKAWYLMGAGAALGAIWSGASGTGNSRVQIRATASPTEP